METPGRRQAIIWTNDEILFIQKTESSHVAHFVVTGGSVCYVSMTMKSSSHQ